MRLCVSVGVVGLQTACRGARLWVASGMNRPKGALGPVIQDTRKDIPLAPREVRAGRPAHAHAYRAPALALHPHAPHSQRWRYRRFQWGGWGGAHTGAQVSLSREGGHPLTPGKEEGEAEHKRSAQCHSDVVAPVGVAHHLRLHTSPWCFRGLVFAGSAACKTTLRTTTND